MYLILMSDGIVIGSSTRVVIEQKWRELSFAYVVE